MEKALEETTAVMTAGAATSRCRVAATRVATGITRRRHLDGFLVWDAFRIRFIFGNLRSHGGRHFASAFFGHVLQGRHGNGNIFGFRNLFANFASRVDGFRHVFANVDVNRLRFGDLLADLAGALLGFRRIGRNWNVDRFRLRFPFITVRQRVTISVTV